MIPMAACGRGGLILVGLLPCRTRDDPFSRLPLKLPVRRSTKKFLEQHGTEVTVVRSSQSQEHGPCLSLAGLGKRLTTEIWIGS